MKADHTKQLKTLTVITLAVLTIFIKDLSYLLIFQHLEHSQLYRTQKTFVQECSELGLPISRKSSSPNQQGLLANREIILEQLINTFDNALHDEFFEVDSECHFHLMNYFRLSFGCHCLPRCGHENV
jgi:hypothetical protein